MSDTLSNYVLENYSRAIKMDLSSWLLTNPLPCICERKYDGIRVFLFKSGEKLIVSSKHGGLYTPKGNPKVFSKVPEFVHAPHRMILDGEYVSREGSIHFFDVITIDERDLRTMILEKRKEVLHEILQGTEVESPVTYARNLREIEDEKDRAIREKYEGVILKNPLSTYGHANSWLKLKKYDTIDCFVIDYEETREMKRTGSPRSWFVGVYDEKGEVVDLGKVGSFIERVDPCDVTIGSVIEVRYQEITRDRKLRAPFIIKVRHDKIPRECTVSQLN